MNRAEEQAQIAAFIAAGGVTRCPTIQPEDAAVDGMLAATRGRQSRMAEMVKRSWSHRRQAKSKRSHSGE